MSACGDVIIGRVPSHSTKNSCSSATGFAPTHAVPHGSVRGWHRLTVQTDDLALPCHAYLLIDHRHRVFGPRQIIPGPLLAIPHAPRPPSTTGTFIAVDAS